MQEPKEQINRITPLPPEQANAVSLTPSRQLAFEIGRYLERADVMTQAISINQAIAGEIHIRGKADTPALWEPILFAFQCADSFKQCFNNPSRSNIFTYFAQHPKNSSSIASAIQMATQLCTAPQSPIPEEAQTYIGALNANLQERQDQGAEEADAEYIIRLVHSSINTIYGMIQSYMRRNDDYLLFHIGVMLERAESTSQLLEIKYFSQTQEQQELDQAQWIQLYSICSGHKLTAPKLNTAAIAPNVLEISILDEIFPRSIHYCIKKSDRLARKLAGIGDHQFTNTTTQALGRLRAELAYSTISEILSYGFLDYMEDMRSKINGVYQTIEDSYFSQSN